MYLCHHNYAQLTIFQAKSGQNRGTLKNRVSKKSIETYFFDLIIDIEQYVNTC